MEGWKLGFAGRVSRVASKNACPRGTRKRANLEKVGKKNAGVRKEKRDREKKEKVSVRRRGGLLYRKVEVVSVVVGQEVRGLNGVILEEWFYLPEEALPLGRSDMPIEDISSAKKSLTRCPSRQPRFLSGIIPPRCSLARQLLPTTKHSFVHRRIARSSPSHLLETLHQRFISLALARARG